ncbi:lysozyme inhibitor LprI family protein [Pseudomonas sp. SBB6]|uniref:lysozyme inhibitor LprI family protein n=1 Tax=Pseudomonas sp. SBB6 TaxID=2962032 RepID=UPI0020B6CEA1|nr:lysozyme inhibitor LprI family protein [Pseudomonas sp. SBB6]MCP3748849.1 DUF1311 domain-containing protein [Pseudomonas sp. SBB6]
MYRLFYSSIGLLMALATTAQASSLCPGANTEVQMLECMQQSLKKSDRQLNELYQALVARFKAEGSAPGQPTQDLALKKAQRAWIAFRDASCEFETYESVGGSGFATIHTHCLLKQTQARIQYLKQVTDMP